VLSVVSSQIRTIQEALKNDATRFQFEGREIRLDARTGIFITMNPGYAGRTELPDNLKALFRPVTMVVPDMEQICEIMLFSEGFDTAKVKGWGSGHSTAGIKGLQCMRAGGGPHTAGRTDGLQAKSVKSATEPRANHHPTTTRCWPRR